jgi:D-alanine-D-alanine ligase
MEIELGRIGVLMGGPSTERAVSLKSGKAVYESLKGLGLEVTAIDIKTAGIKENIDLIKSSAIDCAFLALHGRFGEDGQIQAILDEIDIPYTGSGVKASMLAMDKVASREIFQAQGIDVPRYEIVRPGAGFSAEFGFPLVVKPVAHGSSVGLSIVDRKQDLAAAIDLAFSFDDKVIIEEYIRGRELTVGILDENVLPVVEIVTKKRFFDYEVKYQHGFTDYIVPAELDALVTADLGKKALAAHKALGCFGCSRVDIILADGNIPFVLEVNTIPGFTETSLLPKAAKVAGIGFAQLCVKLIQLAYDKAKTKTAS